MRKLGFLAFLFACGALAEVRVLTLRQAISLALRQNPDLALAHLDEDKAEQAIRLARDPFVPKIVIGSGAAYSSGFPMSIEGATPSIFQARAISDVFNRQQSYRIASAKEGRRGVALDVAGKRDDIAFRTAELFLDAERDNRQAEAARRQIETLQRIAGTIAARVTEGRELPIETKKAALNLAKARYREQAIETERSSVELTLASILGLDPADQIRIAQEERATPQLPASEEEAVRSALERSKELKALESRLIAKGFDIRAERAARLPRLDLVAQYGLLARFNNYEDFFRKFERHNGQLGISFQIPIWNGPGPDAAARQAEAESAQIRIQIQNTRARITSDTRRRFQEVRQVEAAFEVARLDLDVTRDQLSVLLAQMQEGRAGLRQVEEARFAESEKWIAFYDSVAAVEKARLNILRQAGILASLMQ
jgi:outer membrane protein